MVFRTPHHCYQTRCRNVVRKMFNCANAIAFSIALFSIVLFCFVDSIATDATLSVYSLHERLFQRLTTIILHKQLMKCDCRRLIVAVSLRAALVVWETVFPFNDIRSLVRLFFFFFGSLDSGSGRECEERKKKKLICRQIQPSASSGRLRIN